MLSSTLAWLGRLPAVAGAVAVTPLIPPPVLSNASTPVTKYFDLIAAHSRGPLTVLGSPGLSPAKSVRSVSLCLVTSASARWFSFESASVLARVGPIPTSRSPPFGPTPVTWPSTPI